MIFEKIKTIPTSIELLDKAFRRSKRAFSGKQIKKIKDKIVSYESMVFTASNIISDNLINIVKMFPNFQGITPFYKELTDLLVNLDRLKQSLSRIHWASLKIHELSRDYISKLRISTQPEIIQKQVFGRISSIINSISLDLLYLNSVRNKLINLPDINDKMKTIIVSGYPNVGKSSFVVSLTNAKLKIASYPFTTTNIKIGHFTYNNILYQVIDTPGLLDRSMNDRNKIELQSIIALKYLKAIILILVDPSESCGYSMTQQLNLVNDIKKYFDSSLIFVIGNKCDSIDNNIQKLENVDYLISTLNGTGIKILLDEINNHS